MTPTVNGKELDIQNNIGTVLQNLKDADTRFGFSELRSTSKLFESWREKVPGWSKNSYDSDIDEFQILMNKAAQISAVIVNGDKEQKAEAINSLQVIIKDLLKILPLTNDVPKNINRLLEYERKVIEKIEKSETSLIEQEDAVSKLFHEMTLKTSMYEKQFDDTYKKLTESTAEFLDDFKTTSLSIRDDFDKDVRKKVDELNDLVEKGNILTHFISGRALSGFFEDRATAEKKSAFKWTVGTWVFAGAALISLVATFFYQLNYDLQEQTINYSFLTTKILFIASLGFIAKWTAKRANKHISEEAKYHRLAVNTHTIDNFISKLKPETQEEVTKAVALKIFTEYESNVAPIEFETANIVDAAKTFLQNK